MKQSTRSTSRTARSSNSNTNSIGKRLTGKIIKKECMEPMILSSNGKHPPSRHTFHSMESNRTELKQNVLMNPINEPKRTKASNIRIKNINSKNTIHTIKSTRRKSEGNCLSLEDLSENSRSRSSTLPVEERKLLSMVELGEQLREVNSNRPYAEPIGYIDEVEADHGNWGDESDSSVASEGIRKKNHEKMNQEKSISQWKENEYDEESNWNESIHGEIGPINNVGNWQELYNDEQDWENCFSGTPLKEKLRNRCNGIKEMTLSKDSLENSNKMTFNKSTNAWEGENELDLTGFDEMDESGSTKTSPIDQDPNQVHFNRKTGKWEGCNVDMSGFDDSDNDIKSGKNFHDQHELTLDRQQFMNTKSMENLTISPISASSTISTSERLSTQALVQNSNDRSCTKAIKSRRTRPRSESANASMNRPRFSSKQDFHISMEMRQLFDTSEKDHTRLLQSWQYTTEKLREERIPLQDSKTNFKSSKASTISSSSTNSIRSHKSSSSNKAKIKKSKSIKTKLKKKTESGSISEEEERRRRFLKDLNNMTIERIVADTRRLRLLERYYKEKEQGKEKKM